MKNFFGVTLLYRMREEADKAIQLLKENGVDDCSIVQSTTEECELHGNFRTILTDEVQYLDSEEVIFMVTFECPFMKFFKIRKRFKKEGIWF